MRTYRNTAVISVSGIVQQRTAHDFDRPLKVESDRRKRKATPEATPTPGFFWTRTTEERHSLVEMVRHELAAAQQVGREEKLAHDAEKLQRREEELIRRLNSIVDKYAAALELYDQWRAQGVKNAKELDAALSGKSALMRTI